MDRKKRIAFIAILVAFILVFTAAFTACKKETEEVQQNNDVELTKEQVEEYFTSLKVDVTQNPTVVINSDSGNMTETGYYENEGKVKVYKKSVMSGSTYENYYGTDYSGYVGSFEVSISDLNHGEANNYSGSAVRIRDRDVKTYADIIASDIEDTLAYQYEQIKICYEICKYFYPEEAYFTLSGTKYLAGGMQLKVEASTMQDIRADATLTVDVDADGRIYNMDIDWVPDEEYVADAFDQYDSNGGNISVLYNNDFVIPSGIEYVSVPSTGYVYTIEGVYFPSDFNNVCTPGSVVNLPDSVESDIFDASTFEGWYYDKSLTEPVEDNAFISSYTGYDRVYPKFSFEKPRLELNGGTLSEMGMNFIESAYMLSDYMSVTAEKDGYTFAGWYFDAELTQPLDYDNGDVVATGDIVLYAKYDKVSCVYFETNADYKIPATAGAVGSKVMLPEVFRRGGLFEGWYTDAALTQPFDGKYQEETVTVYAKFGEGITVDVNCYDGFVYTEIVPRYFVIEKGGDLSELQAKLREMAFYIYSEPVNRYVFSGWYLPDGSKLTSYPDSDITLTAKYLPEAYLTYSMPDGSYQIIYMDASLQMLDISFGNEMTFGEWLEMMRFDDNLLANCGDQDFYYENKFEYWCSDPACTTPADLTQWPVESVVLYAKTSPIATIKFVYDGEVQLKFVCGKDEPDFDSVYAFMDYNGLLPGENAMQALPEGKVFEGWYKDESLTERYEIPTEAGDFPEGIVTVYAKITDAA